MTKTYNVGGRKGYKTDAKTFAGRVVEWATERGHVVDTTVKSHRVMFTIQDASSTKSAITGRNKIMFTVQGKTPEHCDIWLNAFSRVRGSKPKATTVIAPKATWANVEGNPRGGAMLTVKKAGHLPTDKELDYIYSECNKNLLKEKRTAHKAKARTVKAKAKTVAKPKAKKTTMATGVKATKAAKKSKQHMKLKIAA